LKSSLLFALPILFLAVLSPQAESGVLRVPGQYASIQLALGLAAAGDTVAVSPGLFNEHSLVVPSDISLLGSPSDPSAVVIDAQGQGPVLVLSGCSSSTRVSGFTLTGGHSIESGGAVQCDVYSTPTLEDLVITGNHADSCAGGILISFHSSPELNRIMLQSNSADHYGGGIYMTNYCYPSLVDVHFIDNQSVELGGGLCCRKNVDPHLEDCTFDGNQCPGGLGGGAYFYSRTSPTLVRCSFSSNESYSGGGIFADGVFSTCTLNDVHFEGNHATYAGGGLAAHDNPVDVTDVTFRDNHAGQYGGALYLQECGGTLTNVVFWSNYCDQYGGALFCWQSSPTITATTFASNGAASSGGSVYCRNMSHPEFVSSILAFSTSGQAVYCEDSFGVCNPTLECCDVFGNVAGDWTGCIESYASVSGNLTADPVFCGLELGDLRIDVNSPCSPDVNVECGLIGAQGTGCDSPVAQMRSWGMIKAMYRQRL